MSHSHSHKQRTTMEPISKIQVNDRRRRYREPPPKVLAAWLIALAGYFTMFALPPTRVGVPVWLLIGFVALPALIGIVTGPAPVTKAGLRASVRVTALSMFVYTLVSLFGLHRRIDSSSGSSVFLVELFVSVVFAVLAGGVAAGANALRGKLAGGRSAE